MCHITNASCGLVATPILLVLEKTTITQRDLRSNIVQIKCEISIPKWDSHRNGIISPVVCLPLGNFMAVKPCYPHQVVDPESNFHLITVENQVGLLLLTKITRSHQKPNCQLASSSLWWQKVHRWHYGNKISVKIKTLMLSWKIKRSMSELAWQ